MKRTLRKLAASLPLAAVISLSLTSCASVKSAVESAHDRHERIHQRHVQTLRGN